MNCPEELYYALTNFNDQGEITDESYVSALLAEEASDSNVTIGYELEVSPLIIPEVPDLDGYDHAMAGETYEDEGNKLVVPRILAKLGSLGFGGDTDGVYEIKSPYANHPASLAATLDGLISVGLLPKAADFEVPAHLNFGTNKYMKPGSDDHYRAIRILRATEIFGGSNPNRMRGPMPGPRDHHSYFFWHAKSVAGVMLGLDKIQDQGTEWRGSSHRIELRSLCFQDTAQFEKTMEMAYFLVHGLVSEDTEVHEKYTNFDKWLIGYLKRHNLPNLNKTNYPFMKSEDVTRLEPVIETYARHMEKGDNDELAEEATAVISEISDLIGVPRTDKFSEPDFSLSA